MATPGALPAESTSTVATCPHRPVWVVDFTCHRVVRKPCPLCQDPASSSPTIAPVTRPETGNRREDDDRFDEHANSCQ